MKDRVRGRKGEEDDDHQDLSQGVWSEDSSDRRRTRQSPSQQPRKRHNLTDVSPDSPRSHAPATIASPRVFPPPRVRERDAVERMEEAWYQAAADHDTQSNKKADTRRRFFPVNLGDKGTNDRGGWNSAR